MRVFKSLNRTEHLNQSPFDRPVISVHFPKAGGSSVRSALNAAFGADNVLAKYDCDPLDPKSRPKFPLVLFGQNRPRKLHPFLAVHGHFAIQKYERVLSALRIVILREPVENLISIYYYWKGIYESSYRGHAVYEFAKKERLPLLEFAKIPKLRYLMSQTYFDGFDMKQFDIVGTHHRRTEFLTSVSNAIGRPLPLTSRENPTPQSDERDNVMSDSVLIQKLRIVLHDDIKFYETYTRKC
jgi:hypothetical protein